MDLQVEKQQHLELARSRVGSLLGGKFRLRQLLGVGGMAAVYEAQHRNGKRVALKVMHRSLDGSARERERFLREAYAANTIRHDGVVQIFDDGVDASGAVFLVMELLEGATLADLQRATGGKLGLPLAIAAAEQLLDVLAIAHERGVIHRDIKPANLFMTKTGQLKVLDFGVARVFEPMAGSTVETQSGAMLGTPAFMPQEQARGRWDEVEARSDLWAAGATLFTLVSGEHVHVADTPNEQLGRAMTMPARSLGSVSSELPSPFVEVVDRALRYERDERWPDARTMLAALREAGRALENDTPSTDSWALEMSSRHAPNAFGVATLSAAATSAAVSLRGLKRAASNATMFRSMRWVSLGVVAIACAVGLWSLKLRAREPSEAPVRALATAPSAVTNVATAARAQALAADLDLSPVLELKPAKPTDAEAASAPPAQRPLRKRPPHRTASEAPPVEQVAAPPVDPLDIRY